jgi:hypothetical protein
MGHDDIYRIRKAGRRARAAKEKALKSKQWLIVCEGAKTEPHYFRGLIDYFHHDNGGRDISPFVHIKGIGRNTESLMRSVEGFFERVESEYGMIPIPFGNIAVVFDRDSFGKDAFNHAVSMAAAQRSAYSEIEQYIPAWSNESFELWILLHFQYMDSALTRGDINDKLTEIFRKSGLLANAMTSASIM